MTNGDQDWATGMELWQWELGSDSESRTRTAEREPCNRRTGIASGKQEDSPRGDPGVGFGRWHNGSERGLHVGLEQRSGRGSRTGDLRQDFDCSATIREGEKNKD